MRILIATPYLPWPLHSGGNASQFSTLQCLAEDHQFTVVCPVYTGQQRAHAAELASRLPRVKIRAVHLGPPPPAPDSRKVRLRRALSSLARRALRDRVPPVSAAAGPALPYDPFQVLPPAFLGALAEEIHSGVDLCQAEFAEMLSLAGFFPPEIPRVFVHHQIHSVYAQRFIAAHGATPAANYLLGKIQLEERAFLNAFDAVVTFSDHDRRTLERLSLQSELFVSPFPVPADVGFVDAPEAAWNGSFYFLGSEEHQPNRDGLLSLLDEIWPLVAQRFPAARLRIVGQWGASWHARASGTAIDFLNFVPDLPAVLRGGILLVPLRIGSGIRTKIIVAAAQGMPVVSTTIGAEGLPVSDGSDIFLRDRTTAFAEAAIQLAENAGTWRSFAGAGLALARRHFAPEAVRRRRNEIYATMADRRRSTPAAS